MVKMALENVRRQNHGKKNLKSPLQHSFRMLAINKFLATIYMKMAK
jgi:hypothetical protein